MTEINLVFGTTVLLQKLDALIVQEVSSEEGKFVQEASTGRGCLDDDLQYLKKNLKMNLKMVSAVIDDAERRQENDHDVRGWLRSLKDVAYSADDVLDDLSYESMIRGYEMDNLLIKVRNFFSSFNRLVFKRKMANRIKDINEKLYKIATEKAKKFAFSTNIYVATRDTTAIRRADLTSLSDLDKIVGREKDKSKIVDLLLKSSSSSSSASTYEKISVIPIVGTGGIGKTKLAELVYNDECIKNHFEPRIWVFASEEYDMESILKEILKFMDNDDVPLSYADNISNQVREKLKGKKYLLVLDDFWIEDAQKWETLKSCLIEGSDGSMVLVTTRKIHVAWLVQGIFPTYNLEHLSTNDCWSIIKEIAVSSRSTLNPGMVEIGKEIAKKCCGLPFAATILGQIMYSSGEEEAAWASIRETNIVDRPEFHTSIIRMMKLSYDQLTPALKQCFSYCSIFPKGWEIDKEGLIQLWMAEGFLQHPSGTGISMEDVGNEYFNSLLCHSLFQNLKKDEFGDIEKCKMNDFVHYFARTVVGKDECAILKAEEVVNCSETRRVHLVFDEDTPKFSPGVDYVDKLRTFFAIEVGDYSKIGSISQTRNLRVLYLSGSSIQSLPASISKMKHLRYLNLSRSPNLDLLHDQSINSLFNLQTLVLHCCSKLSKLPEDFGSLKNLRHLDLSYTEIRVLPNSITSLCKMQTLNISYCRRIAELPKYFGDMKDLQSLDISHSAITKLPDSIINLHNLVKLRLHSCRNLVALPKGIELLDCSTGLDISGTKIKPESLA